MGKPSLANCALVLERGDFSLRVSRVGAGPLVSLWVHEHGNGGRGIILDVAEASELIECLNDLLDEIEGVRTA